MLSTKLLLVSGMSGAGKSTTAQNLARQLRLNGVRCRYLHEEIRHHPIRDGEFTLAPLDTEADYQRNIQDMFRRWEQLMKRILRSKNVYVMEGTLTEHIIRYFFAGNYPSEKILSYYEALLGWLAPVNPVVVFLYRSNVQATLEAMYTVRGDWWKNLILGAEDHKRYMNDHGLSGEAGVYTMWENYQQLGVAAVQNYPGPKIIVDTAQAEWDKTIEQVTRYLGLEYYPPKMLPVIHPELYCGQYAVQIGKDTHTLSINYDGTYLYAASFWPYMRLQSLGGSRFEFASFPIKLVFRKGASGRVESLDVSGIYDWEIVGTTMKRVE